MLQCVFSHSSSVVNSYIVAFQWSCLVIMYGFDPKTATGNLWSTVVSLLYLLHVQCCVHYTLTIILCTYY